MKKNCILVDWKPNKFWEFEDELRKQTNEEWITKGINASGKIHNKFQKIYKVYLPYIFYPFYIFLFRNKYKTIIAWQQIFGLIFSFYCIIFHVKSYPKIIIHTFIYKEKRGILGKIYYNFVSSILHSKYIYKVIVFSANEKEYYTQLFYLEEDLVKYCQYSPSQGGIHRNKYAESKDDFNNAAKYFIAPGRSNRDYGFLLKELQNTEYNIKIVCDSLNKTIDCNNIIIEKNVFGNNYLKMMEDAFAVIVPLEDHNISSGQLVFLTAMQYCKPIIVTNNNSVSDYIVDTYNGIIIEKNGIALRNSLKKLTTDFDYYKKLSYNEEAYYSEYFSIKSYAEKLLKII